MLARYWARDLVGPAPPADHDAVTAAVAALFGLTDGLLTEGATLRYPEPLERHPVGARAQRSKIDAAVAAAGRVPVIAFTHAYGPVDDVVARHRIARESGRPTWINRYGYLSDAKLGALASDGDGALRPVQRAP
jgi:hypothetical protein